MQCKISFISHTIFFFILVFFVSHTIPSLSSTKTYLQIHIKGGIYVISKPAYTQHVNKHCHCATKIDCSQLSFIYTSFQTNILRSVSQNTISRNFACNTYITLGVYKDTIPNEFFFYNNNNDTPPPLVQGSITVEILLK